MMAKIDLLIESQKQLHNDFQKRKEKKKKVLPFSSTPSSTCRGKRKGVEEKKSDNPCKSASILF